jgi:hypothetical protein
MTETELELARGHVLRGRIITGRQIARVQSLKAAGADDATIALAESTLTNFETSQRIFEEHLEMLEASPGRREIRAPTEADAPAMRSR